MRPRSLDEFVGQQHFLGPGKLLRRMISADRVTSAIFHGPAGTGKTSLACIIAHSTNSHFEQVNAAAVGVKEIRELLAAARERLEITSRRTVLFIDEIHRFNRSQQDILLDDVENGTVILLGATTENPYFSVNSPLLSRSQVFEFQPLSEAEIANLLRRAFLKLNHESFGRPIELTEDAANHLAVMCDGDARRALTALEVAVRSQEPNGPIVIDIETAVESIQKKVLAYNKSGDQHFDAASALIKSIRGSDPDAAVYWLARMLEAGEDPRFIARRIVIAAAEDIGNAEPQALVIAQAAADATNFIGLPECQLPLAQAAIYLACCPKSNAAAKAIWSAVDDVRNARTIPVPMHLRNAGPPAEKESGQRADYRYPHDAPGGILHQEYLGVERTFYVPTDRGVEASLARYLELARQTRSKADRGNDTGST
jgi:putative ATPase